MSNAKQLTNEKLKELQPTAMVYRGVCTDLDECKSWGIWQVTTDTNGTFPYMAEARYSVLEVLLIGSNVMQRMTSKNGKMAIRTFIPPNWESWRVMTQILTPEMG